MYYEEAIVNEVLSYRCGPHDEWIPYDAKALTRKLRACVPALRTLQLHVEEWKEVLQ